MNLCENRTTAACPIDCTFWDCIHFKPTQYFLDGLNDRCPIYDDCSEGVVENLEPMVNEGYD